jgi:nucleoside-triphosphatase THEP1
MLIISVTGPVGSGKTTLLLQLTAWFQQQHKGVDGFLAIAGDRSSPNQGASAYRLQMIATGQELMYAIRNESKFPPYIFNAETERKLQIWGEEIKSKGTSPLILLDEFGPREVSGKGHVHLWDLIKSANPSLVVISVRKELLHDIEQVLQMQCDLSIDVEDRDAWNKLRTACMEHDDWKRVGMYGAAAGGFEASVGTMLHTAQIPFRGIALSSVQSVVMTYAGDGLGVRGKVVWVPFISAGIKALSPSGNRLNPMLAISMQGFLYTASIELLGWNVLGVAIGGFLIGAWAAAQGVILQFFFIGGDLVQVYDMVLQWIASKLQIPPIGLVGLLIGWSSIAGLFSSSVTLYAYKKRHSIPKQLQRLLTQGTKIFVQEESIRSWKTAIKQSFFDLARPFFWIPIALVVVMILISGSSLEGAFWVVVRASTIAMIFFSLARAFEPRAFLRWLQKRGYWGPAYAFRMVFLSMDKKKENERTP